MRKGDAGSGHDRYSMRLSYKKSPEVGEGSTPLLIQSTIDSKAKGLRFIKPRTCAGKSEVVLTCLPI